MSKRETYFYIFYFVDGTTQEFESDNDSLSSMVMNTARERIEIDNVLINMHNVIKVTVETKSQREEEKRIALEEQRKTAEAISKINF